jgi:transcriptional regulator with XRE-family HTH domain
VPRTASIAAAHVGQHIVGHRKSRGITQDQLAAASGIDSSNIRAYENGRNMPNLYSLMRLAQALSVEPGELLIGLTLEMFERDVPVPTKESPPALSR